MTRVYIPFGEQVAAKRLANRDANACREASRTPEAKARHSKVASARMSTPEAKARAKARRSTPEAKARAKALRSTPEAKAQRFENIAILDMETDPFNNGDDARILPFLCVIYRDGFEPIVIWEDYPQHTAFVPPAYKRMNKNGHRTNEQWTRYHAKKDAHDKAEEEAEMLAYKAFCHRVRTAIEDLPGKYKIYAHNGGKFDFMFLLPELRGPVMFKGRGIMRAQIGNHELLDSYNIIPASLKDANRKDDIDYAKMKRCNRDAVRDEIIKYCIADCRYLLELVRDFVETYGFRLSIGQAAMKELKKNYETRNIGGYIDALLRQYYHGGRVECLKGAGHFLGNFKLFDVNSMYPAVMREYQHPIGNGSHYIFRSVAPAINEQTVFITLECDNQGALLAYDEAGELTTRIPRGIFNTTIHEFRTATRLGLISSVRLIKTVDCSLQTTFAKFVDPLYAQRREWIEKIDAGIFGQDTSEYYAAERVKLFLKLIMNNAYGKFAQDPSRFKEWYVTSPGDTVPPDKEPRSEPASDYFDADLSRHDGFYNVKRPQQPDIWTANYKNDDYWLWSRPTINKRGGGYYNVGTAASITGAARARLMEAIHYADNPIYCDTDSLLCDNLTGICIDHSLLGAWKCEGEFVEAFIAGKKSYAMVQADGKAKIRHKGGTLTLSQIKAMVLDCEEVPTINKGCTISRDGKQTYIERTARVTAKRKVEPSHGANQ